MSEKLKPCPFCGKDKILVTIDERIDRDDYRFFATAFCEYCFAEHSSHGFYLTAKEAEEQAVKNWNYRVSDIPHQVKKEGINYCCPECGKFAYPYSNYCNKCGSKLSWE